MTDRDEQKKPDSPAAKPRVVRYGFACGGGPCRTLKIYETEPTPPQLPKPAAPSPKE
jgi:hypothetical protein